MRSYWLTGSALRAALTRREGGVTRHPWQGTVEQPQVPVREPVGPPHGELQRTQLNSGEHVRFAQCRRENRAAKGFPYGFPYGFPHWTGEAATSQRDTGTTGEKWYAGG
jgi:hypothetical protein